MDKHEHYKKWHKKRVINFNLYLLRVPLILILIFLLIANLPWFINTLCICAIVYYWVEVGSNLKDSHVLNKSYLCLLIISGIFYLILDIFTMWYDVSYPLTLTVMINRFYFIVFFIVLVISYDFYYLIIKRIMEKSDTNREI